MGKNTKKPYWGCNCGFATNWACKPKCHKCGGRAPYKVVARIADAKAGVAAQPKAKAKAKAKAQPNTNNKGGDHGGGKVEKLQQQLDAEKRQHTQELKKLREELQQLRKSTAAKTSSAATGNGEDADSKPMELEDGAEELDKAVEKARVRLNAAKDWAEEVRDLVVGGYDGCIAKLQEDLSAAQAARRAANPLKRQLGDAEGHKARMAKKAEVARAKLVERQAEYEEACTQLALQKSVVEEAEAAEASAAAEVATLAAKYASERTDTTGATPNGTAVAEGNPPPGYVSIAFAEEKWLEREKAFAQHIAQTLALAGSSTEGNGTPSEASPSVAGDLGSVEDLEDDANWNKVASGRRKTLLCRERNILASKVRANLGKVSTGVSPFLKKSPVAGATVL